MKDLTLRQIEYFLAILDRGSVSAAAEACNVSQATISASLSQLEKQLDVTLLTRGPARRARPTAAGRDFGIRARDIVASVTVAVESIASPTAVKGPLRIGFIPTAAPRILPGFAVMIDRRFPALELTFVEAPPVRCQRMVLDGELDIAVLYYRQLQFAGLHRHDLAEARPHALVSADHRLADRPEIDLRDLMDDPFILPDSPPTAELLVGQMRHLGHDPEVRWLISDAETIRSMVALGLGVSLVNAVPHPQTRSFHGLPVRYRPLTGLEFTSTVIAVTAEEARMSNTLAAALTALRDAAEATDPTRWNGWTDDRLGDSGFDQ
ncbi:LysR family transcriptional regulator [Brevibacterium ammoniilyticum]|uniref:LysR family transcriptional regulator n=1 Tax=Brevibacterium ammoniilyticum TaxID=1046555 RepID=A0ABP9TX52_9MICO